MNDKPVSAPTAFTVVFPDTPELSVLHVNALNMRLGTDEFILTLGIVLPPDISSPDKAKEMGYRVTAQPLFQFAITRDTMGKFLQLMKEQYDRQTAVQQLMQEMGGLQ